MPQPTFPIQQWATHPTFSSGGALIEAASTRRAPSPSEAANGFHPGQPFQSRAANHVVGVNAEWLEYLFSEVGRATFGDGSDGPLVVDGTTYTATRDMYFETLDLINGATYNAAGFRVFVRGVLTLDATSVLHNNGQAAGTLDGGLGAPTGSIWGGGNGADSGNISPAPGQPAATLARAIGGSGGAGGASGEGEPGGPATPPTRPSPTHGGWRDATAARAIGCAGGTGGSSGGGGTFGLGGAGGGGAGLVQVFAFDGRIAGRIQANGGNGGRRPSASASGVGGGGGGGGGAVYAGFRLLTLTGAIEARGGRGGLGFGIGMRGDNGEDGFVLVYRA